MDDLDAATLGQDLDAALGEAGAPHPEDPSWRVTPKDTAEPEPEKSLTETLEAASAAQDADGAAEAAWRRELNGYLEPHRDYLNKIDKGSKGAIRTMFRTEAQLRSAPAEALPALVRDYSANLDQAGKMKIAAGVLGALGLEHAGQIGEAERQRLTSYESTERQRAAAIEASRPRVEAQVSAFAAQHPDFEGLRPLMASFVSTGAARDLGTAYQMAARAAGVPDRAQADAEQRRAAVAKAKNAATPKTPSVAAPPQDLSKLGLNELLEHQFAELSS